MESIKDKFAHKCFELIGKPKHIKTIDIQENYVFFELTHHHAFEGKMFDFFEFTLELDKMTLYCEACMKDCLFGQKTEFSWDLLISSLMSTNQL